MTPGEIVWRARTAVRDAGDRVRIPLGLIPAVDGSLLDRCADPKFRLTDVPVDDGRLSDQSRERGWRTQLLGRAERIRAHHLTFFDIVDRHLGDPVRWNHDHERDVATPLWLSQSIDYRDYAVTGDCKVVWEPSRHHQLVVLARAYRATGDRAFALEVASQVASWIDQCPFGRGMQWRSPLEIAIRAINWVWAYDLIREAAVFDEALRRRFIESLYRHVWEISRKFSQGSSANNHVIGEAAGVFVACSYFPQLDDTGLWRERSAEILEQEMHLQSFDDGGGREQAFGYHNFVSQFFLYSGVIARRAGRDFSPAYWSRLERMLQFACRMVEGGPAPMFGDADDGYVLDLGGNPRDIREVLAIGAALFTRADFKQESRGHEEPLYWLGRDLLATYDGLAPCAEPLAPVALPETGYYLLQCGHKSAPDRISVIFDCGELGFGALAAHGHADALSVVVRAFGEDLLVDPGTYDYFTYPEWRNHFRSTRAHNTITVGEESQSAMQGLFLWGRRASARCIEWTATPQQIRVIGEHDGYASLKNPARHRRTVELDVERRLVTITDDIVGDGAPIAVYFHLSERCALRARGDSEFELDVVRGAAVLSLDPLLRAEVVRGGPGTMLGWVSRGYHRKEPSTTVVGHAQVNGSARFVCRVSLGPPRAQA
jgi:hypothetical protein